MTDETKSPDQPEATPESKPLDLEALVSKINDGLDKRLRGWQSLMDQRDAEYRQALDDLKNADLSPEEREQVAASKLQQERDELARQVELLSMRKDYPDEVDFVSEFIKKPTYQEQLALLREFRKANAPAQPEAESAEAGEGGEPTPVDKNNPARPNVPGLEAAAERMNQQLADQILSASGNEKGLLAKLRLKG